MNNCEVSYDTRVFNELILTGKPLTPEQSNHLFQTFKYGEQKIPHFSKYIHDEWMVDLHELSDEHLLLLNQHTKWLAPSYFLRKRYVTREQIEQASEPVLICLVQSRSAVALECWIERYRDKWHLAPDELLVLLYQQGVKETLSVLTKRYSKNGQGLLRQIKGKGLFFKGGMDDNDVLQEIMYSYIKSIQDYKIERKMDFYRFARHVTLKSLQTVITQSKNKKNKSLNSSISIHTPLKESEEITLEDMVESNATLPALLVEKKKYLYEIWEEFTGLEKHVIILRAQGYKYKEIASIIHKDIKAVDNAVQRIHLKVTDLQEKEMRESRTKA